jgi:hypothetical protein
MWQKDKGLCWQEYKKFQVFLTGNFLAEASFQARWTSLRYRDCCRPGANSYINDAGGRPYSIKTTGMDHGTYLLTEQPKQTNMAAENNRQQERVRNSTAEEVNEAVDEKTAANVRRFGYAGTGILSHRLEELNQEWDIEKVLEVNAAALALTGLALGSLVNKKWYLLSGLVTGFLLQHGLQGWCPPLPLFRKLGIRTKNEINEERTALKALRGDFKAVTPATTPTQIMNKLRRT